MAKVPPGSAVVHDEAVVSREACQGDLKNDLARALRPAIFLFRFLKLLQFAADINKDTFKGGA